MQGEHPSTSIQIVTPIGILAPPSTGALWYSFELDSDKLLEITVLSSPDVTEIGLYDEFGSLITNSENSLIRTIQEGKYFIALGIFNTLFRSKDFEVIAPAQNGGIRFSFLLTEVPKGSSPENSIPIYTPSRIQLPISRSGVTWYSLSIPFYFRFNMVCPGINFAVFNNEEIFEGEYENFVRDKFMEPGSYYIGVGLIGTDFFSNMGSRGPPQDNDNIFFDVTWSQAEDPNVD